MKNSKNIHCTEMFNDITTTNKTLNNNNNKNMLCSSIKQKSTTIIVDVKLSAIRNIARARSKCTIIFHSRIFKSQTK